MNGFAQGKPIHGGFAMVFGATACTVFRTKFHGAQLPWLELTLVSSKNNFVKAAMALGESDYLPFLARMIWNRFYFYFYFFQPQAGLDSVARF